jgi:thioesterase domain-containing protein
LSNSIYALEAPGLWDDGEPLARVEELAEHFISAIQRVHPKGDFLLIGSSFGGMVAFEMSRRLGENGTPPRRTILIDSPGPGHLPRPFNNDEEILAYLLAGDDPGGLFESNLEELEQLPEDQHLAFVTQKLSGREEDSGDITLAEMASIIAVYKTNIKAIFAYRAHPSTEKLVFSKPERPTASWPNIRNWPGGPWPKAA